MKTLVNRSFLNLVLVFGLVCVAHANKAFVDTYYDNFKNGSLTLQTKTCEKIHDYSGITDERIFDLIEMKLLSISGQKKIKGEEKKAAICFARALASSGNMKYKQSLVTVSEHANNRGVRKTAEEVIPKIESYQRWNEVINSGEYELQGRSTHLALWMRLVASGDAAMGIYALEKATTFKNYDLNFLILLEEKLHAAIPLKAISEDKLDFYQQSMTYLMSHPEFGKYTSLINEVAEQAKNEKLVKLAHRALRV